MKIKWLGQACFVITSGTGTKIVTDPYNRGGDVQYGEIKETADIVTVSHDHFDHNNVAAVQGNPAVVRGTATVKGIDFQGIPAHHDEAGGSQRGNITMFCFEMDGIRVCHPGDLGHLLSDNQVAEIGRVDVLLIPVGGFYTIGAEAASQVCNQLKPKIIIPMHFKTEGWAKEGIAPVDEFLRGKEAVTRLDVSEVAFEPGNLPDCTQIMVLRPAL